MAGPVEIGLDLVAAGNAPLTFIFFIAFVLLGVLGLRFGVYAQLNGRVADQHGRSATWWALTLVGVTAAVYALLGVVDVVSSLETPYRRGVFLSLVLALSFGCRLLARAAIPAGASGAESSDLEQIFWAGGAVLAVLVVLGTAVAPDLPLVSALEALSGAGFAAVGFAIGRRGASASRVQGTVVDTLLRHLMPVLLFASLVPIGEFAVLAGMDREIVLHIQVVFIIMTATALMTATIKLRQNLAGL